MDNVWKSTDQATLTLKLLKKLDITPQPMFRPQGAPIEPLTLFQKMGVGQLELYVINPGINSQEYQTLMQNWPETVSSASESQTLPLTALASVCALLVWHPACPQEKVVRVLFPGVTPQAKLLEGLEKLRGLAFLQKPTVTTGDMEKLEEDRKAKRTESQDSGKSQGKETTPRQGKERGVREEGKEASTKEKGKVFNGVGTREEVKRDADKAKIKENGVKQKAAYAKKGGGKDGKKEEKTGKRQENGSVRKEMKKDVLPSKPKNENKTKLKKESKHDPKTGGKKTSKQPGKEMKQVHVNAELTSKTSTKPHTGTLFEILEPAGSDKQQQNQKPEKEAEENLCGSKMSTPEDMTSDFLKLREETLREEAQVQRADEGKQKCSESGNEKSPGGQRKETSNQAAETREEEAAGGAAIMEGESGDNGRREKCESGEKTDADLLTYGAEQHRTADKPDKAPKDVGFPSPFNKTPKSERAVQLDFTPTEYTPRDVALKNSPPSRSSPENLAPLSPDEETIEPVSSDSRPNSAGHTPYCLSPDDVWGNGATLSRLPQAQISHSDTNDANQPNGLSKQGQTCEPKSTQDSHTSSNPKEKHLGFLSLGSFKDGSSDPSPSFTTTTTTHSMPAEVSSPLSTEVDESLSMSFEQGPTAVSQREGDDSVHTHSHPNGSHFVGMSLPMKKQPKSLGQISEVERPSAPGTLHFEVSSHDVDLCLVSPCEFKHFKPPDSSSGASEPSRGALGAHHHGNNSNNNINPKDTSASESNAPVCTEDCPSTTADGALDSDEEESCSEPTNSPHDHPSCQSLPPDPLPAPLRDSPPLPPHPDVTMPVPQSDSDGKRAKGSSMRGKKGVSFCLITRRKGLYKICYRTVCIIHKVQPLYLYM